ncbi:hypothetical protein GCM10023149_05550 [Mucilaginibacter gynuensis]|uniref:F5/8 type C domain-containing protein n=1 Tax=Mucilaginibacter gynuensis TaxID=1302236 RepID=A0ABP8FTS9_9SPHI
MKRSMFKYLLLVVLLATCGFAKGQGKPAEAAGNGNPIIPGYFADPTVRKFGDTFYIYATTDGNGGGHGPSQVWTSKDFVNWTLQDMNWPASFYYWAPDVIKANDNKYYMYYCQPVDIYGASSSSPTGPWTPLLPDNKPMITNYFVQGVITLDGQAFKDDDGKVYMFWGTWGIYPDHGCGVGLLNADMHSFAKTAKIPNTIAKEFFEAPFMFKRNGIYYLTYSSGACENETYRVQYAISKTGPMGPFEFGKNNPVLSTNADGTIHGPGHQSVVQVGKEFYMVYHRHNNPHANGGYHRQVCADKIVFDKDGNIEKIVPTHEGVGALAKLTDTRPDLAYGKKVGASSFYSDDYKPEYVLDHNNGTVWKPAKNDASPACLTIDLGTVQSVKQIETQFEYATWYYQYKLETSADGENWQPFADRTKNVQHGSPMIDRGEAKARYVRLTITDTEYPGLFKAVWNIRVFGSESKATQPENLTVKKESATTASPEGLLVSIDAAKFQPGETVKTIVNEGKLTGNWNAEGKPPYADLIKGKKAIVFNGTQQLQSSFEVPRSLWGNNSFSVLYSVYYPELKDDNPVLSWTSGETDHTAATFGAGSNQTWGAAQHFGVSDFPFKNAPKAGEWHDVAITFDGNLEKVFIDGQLDNSEQKMLFLQRAERFIIGSKTNQSAYFNGAIASLKVFAGALPDSVVKSMAVNKESSDIDVYLDAAALNYGNLPAWANSGSTGREFSSTTNNTPAVRDVAGKIAVDFSEGKELKIANFQKTGKPSTIAMSLYFTAPKSARQYWQFAVKTNDTDVIYLDEKPLTDRQSALYKKINSIFLAIEKGEISNIDGAISKLIVYNRVLRSAEIIEINDLWLKNLHPPIAGVVKFEKMPLAISPTMAEMTAATSESDANLQYLFTDKTIGNTQNAWTDQPYFLATQLQPDRIYDFTFKVKDNLGNVSAWASVGKVNTAANQFSVFKDDFETDADYRSGKWDGFTGGTDTATATVAQIADKQLKLQSKGTNWDGNQPLGPFVYKEVNGDFVAQVRVTDITGFATQKVNGNNEAGLMVRRAPDATDKPSSEALIQNGIFPAWKCGNLVTNLQRGRRNQFNTQSGWAYKQFIQIQKTGEVFHLRASADGFTWEELPGSPFIRPDLNNVKLQIGLYQCSYGPKEGYGKFAGFNLTTGKK